jgi:hypothetical protein
MFAVRLHMDKCNKRESLRGSIRESSVFVKPNKTMNNTKSIRDFIGFKHTLNEDTIENERAVNFQKVLKKENDVHINDDFRGKFVIEIDESDDDL